MNITIKDKAGVFFWRNLMMPVIAAIGGKKYPNGKVKEFSYGTLKDEKLDFITPIKSTKKRLAVVHIHGGAWVAGSKGNFYSKPLLKYSEEGYPVFSLNYPLAPEQQHPYLLLGIYISNPELLKQLDKTNINDLPKIKSVVDIFGVNDRTSWMEDGFPSAKLFNKVYTENTTTPEIPMFPMDFVNIKNLPPLYIVGAGNDKLLRSSKIWAEHISKQFPNVEFKIYEGAAHGFFSFGKGSDELLVDMLNFFDKHN